MSLRFFADHCVPGSVVKSLREAGHETLLLREHLPKDSPDTIVIAKAQDLEAILVSFNGDFCDIVRFPPARYRGIIALQIRDHPEIIPVVMRRFIRFLSESSDPATYAGKLFLVEPHRIRIRT